MNSPLAVRPTVSWRRLLDEQDRVISRRQARKGGMSEDQWQWKLDTGRWQAVLRGVAVAHDGEVTDRQRRWAAVLYVGPDAHLSADAALLELGMTLPPPRAIHVVSPREVVATRFTPDADGVALPLRPHRSSRLRSWAHPARELPVLRAPVATVHAAVWASSDRAAEWRVAAAVQQRLTRPGDVRRVLEDLPRLPRRALLREVLEDVEHGAHAGSELDFLRFLRRHGLPDPDRLQRPVRRGRLRYLDAWWERRRVGVEVDGVHHRTVGVWDDDALRANDVVLVERHDRILLLRFTRGNLRHDGVHVAAQLRDALLP